MTAERLKICIEQIRALNTGLSVLLQPIQELDETSKQHIFSTLIFLSEEMKKELAHLEQLLSEQEAGNILNNN